MNFRLISYFPTQQFFAYEYDTAFAVHYFKISAQFFPVYYQVLVQQNDLRDPYVCSYPGEVDTGFDATILGMDVLRVYQRVADVYA